MVFNRLTNQHLYEKDLITISTSPSHPFSCQDSEDSVRACGVKNPVKNLAWLSEKISEIESGGFAENTYLLMSTYQGQTVFSIGYCCPGCLSVVSIFYNCEGEIVQGDQINVYLENSKVIWTSKNSTCGVG